MISFTLVFYLLFISIALGDEKKSNMDKVDDSIRRGVEFLIKMQRMDGSWNSYKHSYNIGQTALSALAIRKAGVAPDHPSIQKAINFLTHNHPVRTYDVSVLMVLLEAVDSVTHQEWICSLAEMLVDSQKTKLWAYPTRQVDMSNTQYAALGLNAAMNCGFRTNHKVWRDLLEGATDYQSEDGGWGYRRGSKSTGSMTCAGLTCLYVCERQLRGDGKKKVVLPGYEKTVAEGLAWLDKYFTAKNNPRPHEKPKNYRWTYYYLYGIERIGALSKRQKFGEKDWYQAGVNWLVPKQAKSGSWSSAYDEKEMNTSFALLFLSRATLGARTKGGFKTRILSQGGKKNDIVVGCNRKNPGYIWIESWSEEVAKRYGIDGGKQAIRVDQVEYYEGETLLGTVQEQETDTRITRLPLQYHFTDNGEKELFARVTCRSKHGTMNETFESGKIKIFIHDNFSETDRIAMEDVGQNLIKGAERHVTVSTQWSSDWRGSRAADGLQGSAWLSAKIEKDESPWIQIDFDTPIRANRLKLTHAMASKLDLGRYGRASKIRVIINRGKQKCLVDLGTDDTVKYEIPFRRTRVRELRIEVLDRVAGHRHKALGFSEIELFLLR